ncbi:UDP-3-O-[3-hydroxymyristoyl] N-acetylglucosamine deacetylase [bacterium BMS3Abin07]|nr:UDP-3-O-[3-hydroxymyristoyl] N-acetylglucosamine deacetylase [bacterium BMS3Abin07]GBE33405.1 UDP-3-O-[3-hydroxymyristoyl] N-acetylglucosamine deacetylase [bacterium BMS3Bbin05]
MFYQKTIANEISFEGVGLHTGKLCSVTLRPADINTGIIFFRTDRGKMIKLSPFAVVDTSFATTIGYNGSRIKTIEHLMAVLSAFEIDNLYIDVNGPEIPALDGSAAQIAEVLSKAGASIQSAPRKVIKITKPLRVVDGKANITVLPYNGRKFSQLIEFKNHFLGRQHYGITLNLQRFVDEISPARTFGFLKDVEMLRQHGLGKGGSLDNAVIIDQNGVINPSGTRFPDEFVRHKVLDCIGDLYLCGFQIYGHVIAERSGHTTNVKLMKMLMNSCDCYQTFQFGQDESTSRYHATSILE